MKDKVCRIIKIDRNALFEFIYENFVAQQEELLDVEPLEVSDCFDIDWNTGEFIFAAYRYEDDENNGITMPGNINLKKIMAAIPTTTDSVLNPGKKYKDYTFEELAELSDKQD